MGRNFRATRFTVVEELARALGGWSLLDPTQRVAHGMERLFVTGHSLGGAMSSLFAPDAAAGEEHRAIGERLHGTYTFGQPMTLVEPIPELARAVGPMLFRHVLSRDVVLALPPVSWGHFAHFGQEYRYLEGAWRRAQTPVAQVRGARDVHRAVGALVASAKRRCPSRSASTCRTTISTYCGHETV